MPHEPAIHGLGSHPQRNVLVHKFVTEGTVEERIDRLMEEKRKLADDVVDGAGEVNVTELSDAELVNLVQLNIASTQLDGVPLKQAR